MNDLPNDAHDPNDLGYFMLCDPKLDFDYFSQISAIRALLFRQENFDTELRHEIKGVEKIAESTSGATNQRAVEIHAGLLQESCYQDVAHSMAAVGMLAPLIESIFKAYIKGMGEELPKRDIAKNIPRTVSGYDSELLETMPDLLKETLEALFAYRNKMFHFGFEWPLEEREKFNARLSNWPDGWFGKATSNDEPWMFYMSSLFITHCIDTAEKVLSVLAEYDLKQAVMEFKRSQESHPSLHSERQVIP